MKVQKEKNLACLEVCNSGEIPSEMLKDIQEGRVKGRGLYIIQRFATSQHGSLRVENINGQARFQLRLPLFRKRM